MRKTILAILLALSVCGAGCAANLGLPEQTVPKCFGVEIHFHGENDAQAKQIAEAGFGFVRMDLFWFYVEKQKGEYDFSPYDALLDSLERHGVRAMFILAYGNQFYSGSENDKIAPATEEYRKAYAAFAGAAAAHFKGRNVLWEIWNEPNAGGFWQPAPNVEHYVLMAKKAAAAIRAADPDAVIMGPACYGIDFGFLDQTFKLGLLDAVNTVSVHPYGHMIPEAAAASYKALSEMIRKNGSSAPIVSGEWGYSSAAVRKDAQAQLMIRMFLSNMLSEVPLSIWYDWHDDGTEPQNWHHNFGVVHHDFTPKPAYIAMQALNRCLGGYRLVRRATVGGPEDYVLVFSDGARFRVAAWTIGAPRDVELRIDAPSVVLTNVMGKRRKGEVTEGTLRLPVDGAVTYIDCPWNAKALDLR